MLLKDKYGEAHIKETIRLAIEVCQDRGIEATDLPEFFKGTSNICKEARTQFAKKNIKEECS